jgi:intergrase/recombinase
VLVGLERTTDYYNEENGTLEHFKYPKLFFRHTKNVFISMIPKDLIEEMGKCKPITYEMIRLRLQRKGIKVRINELRDYYATFMVRHGLIKEEVDLLQGRITKSIFVRHYWSPAIKELKERVFQALQELEKQLS